MERRGLIVQGAVINNPSYNINIDNEKHKLLKQSLREDNIEKFKQVLPDIDTNNHRGKYYRLNILMDILEYRSYKILHFLSESKKLEKFSCEPSYDNMDKNCKYSCTIYQELFLLRDYRKLNIMLDLKDKNIIELLNYNGFVGYKESLNKEDFTNYVYKYNPQINKRAKRYDNLIGMCLNRILLEFDLKNINEKIELEIQNIYHLLNHIYQIYDKSINKNIIVEKHKYRGEWKKEISLEKKCNDLSNLIKELRQKKEVDNYLVIINFLNNILSLYEK